MTQEESRTEIDALRLVARAEQCTVGLKRKLKKRRHDETCIDAVVSRLTEQNLIDDLRFARLWLGSRLHLPRSPRRLFIALCGRGIDRDDAKTAMKIVLDEEAEWALLIRFVNKYAKKAGDEVEAARSLKFLLKNEGFSPLLIQRFFEEE